MRVGKKMGRLRVQREHNDFNPLDGMANLADVMLVFATGLLVALIANWNVDVNSEGNGGKPQAQNTYEIQDVNSNAQQTINQGSSMQEMGVVYKDEKTGKYYVVENK